MAAIQSVEPRRLRALPAEQLHDAHPGQAFLKKRVDPCEPDPDVPVRLAHFDAKDVRREIDERNHAERRHREPPVDDQHHHRDHEKREEVTESGDDAGGEQLVERLDVGGHAGDQTSDRIAVEERDRQAFADARTSARGDRASRAGRVPR